MECKICNKDCKSIQVLTKHITIHPSKFLRLNDTLGISNE